MCADFSRTQNRKSLSGEINPQREKEALGGLLPSVDSTFVCKNAELVVNLEEN